MFDRPTWIVRLAVAGLSLAPVVAFGQEGQDDPPAPAPAQQPNAAPGEPLPGPPPIPKVELGPVLPTTPVRSEGNRPNTTMVDASVLPRDKEGIWVLNFAFKPMRIRQVEIPGKGRRIVHYLYYQVINKTGEPRMFVPQFTLVTDTGKRYEDAVIPQAVEVIKTRENPTTELLGAVDIVGVIPPSGQKEGIDDAVFGVAVWEGIDPAADRFSVYVRGLSDGFQQVIPPGETEPRTLYKTLRIDFIRLGDEYDLNEREIRLADPPYEWIYW